MTQVLNRKLQPTIKPPGKISFPQPQLVTLSNGIKVYLFNSGTQDVISVELTFSAGSWFQPKPFVAVATNLMLREGTRNYSAQKLSETLDYYGAHFENTTERDNAYVSLYSLNKHLGHTLPLLAEVVKQPVFPESEFKIISGKQLQILEVNRQKVNFVARTQFSPLIFGNNHPYGTVMNPEDIKNTNADELRSFHKSYYHSGNCMIIVAGKINPGIIPALEKYFGGNDWGGKQVKINDFEILASEEKIHSIIKPGSLQSAIRLGRVMFNRQHPDFSGMKVLNAILGGYFGSRLMTNLREDKGFTYGIGSAVVPLHKSGFFVISTEVGAESTKQALSEINQELLRLCNERVSEKELSLVRNYLSGEMLRAVDGPLAQANLFRELIEDGLDILHFEEMIQTIQQIKPQTIQDLAIRYLNPDKLHTLVVGPEEI